MNGEKDIAQGPLPEQHPDAVAAHLAVHKPNLGATYEIKPDGPISVRFEPNDPENPQTGWSSVKRWRGEARRGLKRISRYRDDLG
jgi:hypothetical protein